MDYDRVLPHNLEAERCVLGAALLSPEAWPVAASRLAGADFFRDAHRQIFEAMAATAAAGPIDFVTLKAELVRRGELEEVGGPAYVASLVDGLPHAANVEHYAALVREQAKLRAAIAASTTTAALAYDAGVPAAQVIERGMAGLLKCLGDGAGGLVTEADAIRSFVAAADAGVAEPLATGYADVDAALGGGLRPAELTIVAARPTVGKTSLALGLAHHVAASGHPVVFFTLEMSVHGLAGRLLAWRTRVPARRLERGELTDEELARVTAVLAEPGVPLQIEPTVGTVAEIEAWCRRAQQAGGLACVVVDYMQMLAPERRRESGEAEMAGISRGLKRLAKALDVAVVALSQLSRAPEGRRDKRPHASDLRGSGALEQDCDVLLLLFRPEMYGRTEENAGVAEVIVAKQRNGPTSVQRLAWLAELAEFRDLARPAGNEGP